MPRQKKSHRETYSEGAQDERDAIRAHLRSDLDAALDPGADVERARYLNSLLAWIDARPIRYRARKGGLGTRSEKAAAPAVQP